VNSFDELPWHYATLVDVLIDRRVPGHDDRIVLAIDWPGGSRESIEFHECWMFDAYMDFGIIVPEHVRSASALDSDDGLERLRQTWSKSGVQMPRLKCFKIEMNSTASVLRITLRDSQFEPDKVSASLE